MLAMLEIKHCQCDDYRRLIDLHSTFVEDTSDAFWGRGRDGRGLNSLGLLHSLVRVGRRRVLIAGSSQTRSMGAAYHDANRQPRWLSGLRRSRVHSLVIARRSLCPEKLGSNPGQGSKGINFSG